MRPRSIATITLPRAASATSPRLPVHGAPAAVVKANRWKNGPGGYSPSRSETMVKVPDSTAPAATTLQGFISANDPAAPAVTLAIINAPPDARCLSRNPCGSTRPNTPVRAPKIT